MRLFTLSSLFPNPVMPNRGLFVKERLFQTQDRHGVAADVCAPLPWFPSSNPRFGEYASFAQVPARAVVAGRQPVMHPKYFMLPRIGSAFSPLSVARAVAQVARPEIERADIIDAHFLFPDGVAGVMLARRFGKPVLLTARGSDVNLMPDEFWAGRWLRWAFAQGPPLVAVSEALAARLRGLAPRCPVHVITNGVDLARFHAPLPKAQARERLGVDGPLVVSVGNLVPLKGHDLVIRAVAALPGVRLLVIGRGPLHDELAGLIGELGVSDRVSLTGAVGQDDLIAYYNAADVLVLASSHEGMPNVLLESLACGTPVVGTADGAAEVIARCRFSRRAARNPQAIGAAVSALLAAAPAPAAVRAAVENDGWETQCRLLHELYTDLIGSGPAAKDQ